MKIATKFVTELTAAETEKLKKMMKEEESSRLRMRAHIILLSNKKYSIDEIADIYDLDRDTASNTVTRWEESGFEGLKDKPIGGRPPILDEEEKELVKELAQDNPRSVKRTAEETEKETGKKVSAKTIKRILKGAGKIWKRVRGSLKSKRDEGAFQSCKEEIEDLQDRADDGEIDLYYFDAAGFCLDPYIPYAWQNRGETIDVPSASRGRINVLGFMNTDNKLESFLFQGSIDAHVVVGCFDVFIKSISRKTVIVMDNSPIHTSDEFQEAIADWEREGLSIKFLPEYSPELNLIEILWRMIKYFWLPFSAYQSLTALFHSLVDILGDFGSKYRISFG
jgi:transposase